MDKLELLMEVFYWIILIGAIILSLIAIRPYFKITKRNKRRWLIGSAIFLWCVLLIFLFVRSTGNILTWDINTSVWSNFGAFIGAFLFAGTLLFQIRAFRRQQVEAKFFEMVRYYRDNVTQMKLRNPFHHKSHEETYAEGRRVLKVIFDQYKVALGIVDFQKVVDINNVDKCLKDPDKYNDFFALLSPKKQELKEQQKKLFIENEIAYLIMYWGVSSGSVKEMESWLTELFKLKDKDKTEVDYPELETELVRKVLKCIALYKCDENRTCKKDHSAMLYSHLKKTGLRDFVGCEKATKKTKFFGGHQYQLGHYFRHLYQVVAFIDEQPSWLFSVDEKYSYVKTLRAQMSNYEQALLFINSLTVMGRNWEYSNKNERNLISDYNLIKNLPEHFIPYMNPEEYYPEVNFEWKEDNSKKKLKKQK